MAPDGYGSRVGRSGVVIVVVVVVVSRSIMRAREEPAVCLNHGPWFSR